MLVSLQRWVTLLPPLNEFLELPECFFRGDVPLVERADLFKFFHDLFLVPWLDFTRNVLFRWTVHGCRSAFGKVSARVFSMPGNPSHTSRSTTATPLALRSSKTSFQLVALSAGKFTTVKTSLVRSSFTPKTV